MSLWHDLPVEIQYCVLRNMDFARGKRPVVRHRDTYLNSSILLLIVTLCTTCCYAQNNGPGDQIQAVKGLIKRIMPKYEDVFVLGLLPDRALIWDQFEIKSIRVNGTHKVSLKG